MRLLADMHVAPRTVEFLRRLGHDAVRVSEVLPPTTADDEIVTYARSHGYVILTQDLDFSALIALSGKASPSLISLRLSSARVDYVNEMLARVLPEIESATAAGAVVAIEDHRVRVRSLPISGA